MEKMVMVSHSKAALKGASQTMLRLSLWSVPGTRRTSDGRGGRGEEEGMGRKGWGEIKFHDKINKKRHG